MTQIFFVAIATDYHATDWYCLVRELFPKIYVAVLTGTINSEGMQGDIKDCDQFIK